MMNVKSTADKLPIIPWEDKKSDEICWRYSKNPIIGWNPVKNVARIFNSAVSTYKDKFVAVFRAEYLNGRPHLHLGWSFDGINWKINEKKILWYDENGEAYQPLYAYDPRLVNYLVYRVWWIYYNRIRFN